MLSGTCYLVPGMGWDTYACLPQHHPWYLVSRPCNMTKLRELGTAFNTSRGGGGVIKGPSENPSVSKAVVLSSRTVTEGDVRII